MLLSAALSILLHNSTMLSLADRSATSTEKFQAEESAKSSQFARLLCHYSMGCATALLMIVSIMGQWSLSQGELSSCQLITGVKASEQILSSIAVSTPYANLVIAQKFKI